MKIAKFGFNSFGVLELSVKERKLESSKKLKSSLKVMFSY